MTKRFDLAFYVEVCDHDVIYAAKLFQRFAEEFLPSLERHILADPLVSTVERDRNGNPRHKIWLQ